MPDQAVVAVNLGEQGRTISSISEGVFHPDLTTVQQHVVGDVVSSGKENGKKSRKPRISEFIIWNDGSLLYCFPCSDFHSSMSLLIFKKCSQCTCIVHFKVRPGELPSVP